MSVPTQLDVNLVYAKVGLFNVSLSDVYNWMRKFGYTFKDMRYKNDSGVHFTDPETIADCIKDGRGLAEDSEWDAMFPEHEPGDTIRFDSKTDEYVLDDAKGNERSRVAG